jgi:hypothetical protein
MFAPAWQDIAYLQQGSPIQRLAHKCLIDLGVLETLRGYDAVLAGTIPLDLATAGSDLDILCETGNQLEFRSQLEREYGALRRFAVRQLDLPSGTSTLASFLFGGFPIEIFGQPVPVRRQDAYRHMEVEHRLLLLGGEQMKSQIARLRHQGAKTEPAFAAWLGLQGDPYAAMLQLSGLSDAALTSWYNSVSVQKDRTLVPAKRYLMNCLGTGKKAVVLIGLK